MQKMQRRAKHPAYIPGLQQRRERAETCVTDETTRRRICQTTYPFEFPFVGGSTVLSVSEADDAVLVPLPESGRVYRDARRVRLGDSSPGGRLRYDAVARYLHNTRGQTNL